jgi:glucose 1-dehydrogenase
VERTTLREIAVRPGTADTLNLREDASPSPAPGELLLRVLQVGVCGTDRDIVSGFYGQSPPESDYLVLGHEALCRVEEVPPGVSSFSKGDLVVPTVRRNCPESCLNCRSGQSDACLTGHYKEHGIKGLHGFAREFATTDAKFVAKLPESLAKTGVLLEPLTIVEKGVEQTLELQRARIAWEPHKALVLGAGPVGLLATALLRLRGFDVVTAATRPSDSAKAKLARQTGADYASVRETPLSAMEGEHDIVLEITGNTDVALEAQKLTAVNGVVCYLGIYSDKTETEDAGRIFTELVLGNRVFFGSVNANLTYFRKGVEDLQKISEKWGGFLECIITKRSTVDDFQDAYAKEVEDEIKSTVVFSE